MPSAKEPGASRAPHKPSPRHVPTPGRTPEIAKKAKTTAKSSRTHDSDTDGESTSMWSMTRWDYTSANAVAQEFVSSMSSKVSVI